MWSGYLIILRQESPKSIVLFTFKLVFYMSILSYSMLDVIFLFWTQLLLPVWMWLDCNLRCLCGHRNSSLWTPSCVQVETNTSYHHTFINVVTQFLRFLLWFKSWVKITWSYLVYKCRDIIDLQSVLLCNIYFLFCLFLSLKIIYMKTQ
jgi:hypothetical protein